jgi:hypothetical protein
MRSWSIGHDEHERVEMLSCSMPTFDCGYEWVAVRTSVRVGGFTAEVEMTILKGDLESFRDQLVSLKDLCSDTAGFTTIEGQLWLLLEVDRKGDIQINGKIYDRAGGGNVLSFTIQIDQSYLLRTLSELDQVLIELSRAGILGN